MTLCAVHCAVRFILVDFELGSGFDQEQSLIPYYKIMNTKFITRNNNNLY